MLKLPPLLLYCFLLTTATLIFPSPASGTAQRLPAASCPTAVEPAKGALGNSTPEPSIESPRELVSRNGRLEVHLRLRNSSSINPADPMQYCYIDDRGDRSPTLRLRPGDLLVLKLTNELHLEPGDKRSPAPKMTHRAAPQPDCQSATMAIEGTNLHFHGLGVSPSCHSDDSLHVSIPPSKTFVYRVRIPRNQPPGLYWYHPHPHGHSEEQVLGGASGALIVEGIAAANPLVRGLPERVFVIRDRMLNGRKSGQNKALDSAPNASPTAAPRRDPSLPAKDLSINFIPVPYPDYPVAAIHARPLTREFWRVLNASADTYVNLGVLFNGEWLDGGIAAEHGSWQPLDLVALDGVPIGDARSTRPAGSGNSQPANAKTEILIPPGGRAEFILETPPEGIKAELITAGADTNPPEDEDAEPPSPETASTIPDNDDNTPPRPLARIVTSRTAIEPHALAETAPPAGHLRFDELSSVFPVHKRTLYFSQKAMDPRHPETSTIFYLTEEGHTPKAFDPAALAPDIVVHQGDVEDWTIENRSRESHAFHIHQSHFLLLERDHEPASESLLLDTVDVPYWDGISTEFPSVKLRMDFRDPEIIGTFPYHCHILQHVDGGMMGLIEVKKRAVGR